MSDPSLSTEGAALADAALVHSASIEVAAAAAGLQQWPLDTAAAVRMRQALSERFPPAQRALSRLQSQSPLPGATSPTAPRVLHPLPSLGQTPPSVARGGDAGPAGEGWLGPEVAS